jgi:hypothetical protein
MSIANTLEKPIETGEERLLGRTVVFCGGKDMRLISMNRLVLELSACLALSGARRITSTAGGEKVYLLLDWDDMEGVFRSFAAGPIMGRQPTSAVRGMWLPVVPEGRNGRKGCAFPSISFYGTRPAPGFPIIRKSAKKRVLRGLSGLYGMIERHHGVIRVKKQQGQIALNIYLPVLERA